MRVVLDTNVFISGLVFGKKPLMVIEFALSGGCVLVVSESILQEPGKKLATKFGWRSQAIALELDTLRESAVVVSPSLAVIDCDDPNDNMFLEAAVEGRAHLIVSGDKHLLRMKAFRGIEILTPNEFLERVGLESREG